MSEDVLTFKKSSVDIRPSVPCRQKYETMNDVDICSPVFNFRRAFSLIHEQTDRQVCDVLLDQSVLPGVGNIIKNE
ncbi:NEIL3-like protein, partial [Mya arenaria]